ncbi:PH domain-containing protein [Acidipropionibacterium jensenii]|uniref:PH domain-containing protein n=1 Tax=Acidipropionibacterium jensenii TaxID=1749 RepID=UPI00214CB1F4|nr:PH domain-containing protein [Acidipropionibacterium jensenii]
MTQIPSPEEPDQAATQPPSARPEPALPASGPQGVQPDPAQAPGSEAAQQAVTEQRPHWATPIVRGWIVLAGVAVWAIKQLMDSWQSGDSLPPVRAILVMVAAVLAIALIQAAIGYFQWRTTTFRIDEEEVRVDHRFIQHSSDRIALTKIQSVDVVQPLAARLIGLARLQIDVGGSSARTIEYLSRADAYRFRDFLIGRAHQVSCDARVIPDAGGPASDAGEAAGTAIAPTDPARPNGVLPGSTGSASSTGTTSSTAPPGAASPPPPPSPVPGSGSVWQDRRVDETVITSVSSRQIVLGTFVSLSFIWCLVLILAGLAIPIAVGIEVISIPVVLAGLAGIFQVVSGSLIKYWRFTLLRTTGGLKVVHGMTTLTTRTVPPHRVQGITISQPLAWRLVGLCRIDVTVLGGAEAPGRMEATTLLPMGSASQLRSVVGALWPGLDPATFLDPASPALHPIPRRARWLRWFDRQTIFWGADEQVIVSRHGLFTRRTTVVPHSRVQSAAVHQGPVQRLLRVADLTIQLPSGPVDLRCRQLDATDARSLLIEEMDRARRARRRLATD